MTQFSYGDKVILMRGTCDEGKFATYLEPWCNGHACVIEFVNGHRQIINVEFVSAATDEAVTASGVAV